MNRNRYRHRCEKNLIEKTDNEEYQKHHKNRFGHYNLNVWKTFVSFTELARLLEGLKLFSVCCNHLSTLFLGNCLRRKTARCHFSHEKHIKASYSIAMSNASACRFIFVRTQWRNKETYTTITEIETEWTLLNNRSKN